MFGVYTFAQILISEIRKQKENVKKPDEILFFNKYIDIYKIV